MQITYRYGLKDKRALLLNARAKAVNTVWNFTQMKAAKDRRPWLPGHDLWKLVAGATKEGADLHSAFRVCRRNAKSRRQDAKVWLPARESVGPPEGAPA